VALAVNVDLIATVPDNVALTGAPLSQTVVFRDGNATGVAVLMPPARHAGQAAALCVAAPVREIRHSPLHVPLTAVTIPEWTLAAFQ
jgi:hypothetical protein